MAVLARLKHAWNAFTNLDLSQRIHSYAEGMTYGNRPDRVRMNFSNERSIIASIYTRLGVDVSDPALRHVRLDENERYVETIQSGLNNCLNLEANLDQAGRAFRQDIAMTLFNKGCAALVPVDTTISPLTSGGFDIKTLRVGEITGWMPYHIRVSVYNEATGRREELTLEKKFVAIVENPFYSVMNEPNSTLQRLIRKLNLLDTVDDQSSSGKLDVFIQLPFAVRSEARRQQAAQRRIDIETQLKGSKYGIAWVDATEKITQLNRPAENNLLKQIEFLTELLYSQLGLTEDIMTGKADEKTMINYQNRTIVPILDAITEAMRRTFLTKTARSQMQTIMYFRDPFKLVPVSEMAEIADKFSRNEIFSANDIRQFMGVRPSSDPKADELKNSNMPEAPPEPIPTNSNS